MKLGNKEISKNSECFIIAELSANHKGDSEVVKETIRAAKGLVEIVQHAHLYC